MNKSQNERAIFSNFSQSKNESVSLFEPFYQPKWQISLFFHKCKPYPFTNSYCWSQKKLPLSVGPPRICHYKEYPHRDALYLVQYIYHMWCWVGFFFFFFFFFFFWNKKFSPLGCGSVFFFFFFYFISFGTTTDMVNTLRSICRVMNVSLCYHLHFLAFQFL